MGEGNMANIINAILTATSLCIMLTGMWMDTLSLLGTSFAGSSVVGSFSCSL